MSATFEIRRFIEIIESAHPFRAVVAHLTTQNTGGNISIGELRRQISDLVNSWRGQVFRNQEIDKDITIVKSSVTKTTQVGSVLLRLHYALPQILRKGNFISEEPAKNNRPGMIKMHTIGASVMLDEDLYHVIAKIREFPGNANHHYSLHFDGGFEIKI